MNLDELSIFSKAEVKKKKKYGIEIEAQKACNGQ